MKDKYWERRGTMIYTEDEGIPGSSQFVYDAGTQTRAQDEVDLHNELLAEREQS